MKLLADSMLGKLAKWLRIMGCDTIYYRGTDPNELIDLASKEGRVILTRNTRLSLRADPPPVLQIAHDRCEEQLKQVVTHFGLDPLNQAFSRCVKCNEPLLPLEREAAQGRVPDHIYHEHKFFHHCPRCGRIYWPGSHQKRMMERVCQLLVREEPSEAEP